MLEEKLNKIEAIISKSRMVDEKKTELQGLMTDLKQELSSLAESHEAQAHSIAGFAEMSSHEITKEPQRRELVELSMTGLKVSAEEFELSHPTLARTINAICIALSKAGI